MSIGIDTAAPPSASPRGEEREPEQERKHHPPTVDQAAGDHDPHQGPDEERREDESVELEAAEVRGDDRHRGRDRQRLRGDEGDLQDEADGEWAPLRRPQATGLRRNGLAACRGAHRLTRFLDGEGVAGVGIRRGQRLGHHRSMAADRRLRPKRTSGIEDRQLGHHEGLP
jgi:hypothetical protein